MDNRDKMEIFKSAAANAVAKMAFVSVMVFGCDNQKEAPANDVITLQDQQSPTAQSSCVIEVPFNEPELNHIIDNGALSTGSVSTPLKFYDFCDSTVSIVAKGRVDGGPIYNVRPITELLGTEKAEMKSAYAKYRQSLRPQ